jgi:hypothetical protein
MSFAIEPTVCIVVDDRTRECVPAMSDLRMKYSFSSIPIEDMFDLRANRRPFRQEERVGFWARELVNAETNNRGHNKTKKQIAIELGRVEFLLVLWCRKYTGVAMMPIGNMPSHQCRWNGGQSVPAIPCHTITWQFLSIFVESDYKKAPKAEFHLVHAKFCPSVLSRIPVRIVNKGPFDQLFTFHTISIYLDFSSQRRCSSEASSLYPYYGISCLGGWNCCYYLKIPMGVSGGEVTMIGYVVAGAPCDAPCLLMQVTLSIFLDGLLRFLPRKSWHVQQWLSVLINRLGRFLHQQTLIPILPTKSRYACQSHFQWQSWINKKPHSGFHHLLFFTLFWRSVLGSVDNWG